MLLYNISSGIQLLLNKCEENIYKKRKKINEGEQDDNAIPTTAASCLLALVNGMDKSNKFNQLGKFKITCQNILLSKMERKRMIML